VGLERGPLSLVSTIEELFERKSRKPRIRLYPQKLSLTSTTSDDRSVGVVRPQTKITEYAYEYGGARSSDCGYTTVAKLVSIQ
jgi:hypothetical protein